MTSDGAFLRTSSGANKNAQDDSDSESNNRARYSSKQDPDERSRGYPMIQNVLVRCVICALVGFALGFALEKGRVFEPVQVRGQMTFKKLSFLKFQLAGLSVGLFGLSLLAMIPATNEVFQRVCNKYYNHLAGKGVVSSIVGGLVLGAGMALSGAGSVLLLPQVATFVPNSLYTLGGALAGTLLYGITKPLIDKFSKSTITASLNPWGESAYFVTAFPLVAMFGMTVLALETLIPWDTEVKVPLKAADNIFKMKVWPPFLTGAIAGLLQVPLVLGIEETLGGNSSYCTMVSQLFVGPLQKLSSFLTKFRWGFASWWQIYYVVGMLGGAFISAWASNSLGVVKGVPAPHAFIGGMLMILGTRIAGGCCIGHGVSGMSFLSILSFLVVACIYVGGIAMATVLKEYEMLNPTVKA